MGGLGFVSVGSAIELIVRTYNTSRVVTAPDSNTPPTYRVYDSSGLVSSGSMSAKDTGTVSGAADNGSGLIRITTSAAHGLQSGDKVTIYGVGGTTEANASWIITVIGSTTFDLVGSTFSNAFSSNGTWLLCGLFKASITASTGNGYSAGERYTAVMSWTITSVLSEIENFTVV